MTIKQRKAMRQRKERNQRLMWWLQDTLGALCLFGICYGLLFVPMLWS